MGWNRRVCWFFFFRNWFFFTWKESKDKRCDVIYNVLSPWTEHLVSSCLRQCGILCHFHLRFIDTENASYSQWIASKKKIELSYYSNREMTMMMKTSIWMKIFIASNIARQMADMCGVDENENVNGKFFLTHIAYASH